jgi:menaquinone-dependent protoporphyrinogen oxidase
LASRPVRLFGSGPLGTEAADATGRAMTVTAEPKEMAEFEGAIGPKGHRVFFGALDAGKLGTLERAIGKLPAARTMLPESGFRDSTKIDAWANDIADDRAE